MTSQKHRDFLAEPMGDKRVKELPGIGDVKGDKLENGENVENRFQKAYMVFGHYLLDEQQFRQWLEDTLRAYTNHQNDCFECLTEWFRRLQRLEWNMKVTELPDFNQDLAIKLIDRGFTQAYRLFGQYLVLKDDEGKFEEWLRDNIHANEAEKNNCIEFLTTWCHQFLYTHFWEE